LEGAYLGFVSVPSFLKQIGKCLSLVFISFMLLGNGFKYSFQCFIHLFGEGYSLEETLLEGIDYLGFS